MGLILGFCLVALLGTFHHFALSGLRRVTKSDRLLPDTAIIIAFVGLLLIHVMEILFFAGVYRFLQVSGWGELSPQASDWTGLIYFSGITFTTLGYGQAEMTGFVRLVSMMQALGGFMVLTWSATFIYTVWKKLIEAE